MSRWETVLNVLTLKSAVKDESKGHFSPIIESFELRPVTCNRIPWSQGFFLIFLRERLIKSEPRSGDNESRKRRGERENLWLPWPRISLSCRRQGQYLTLGRWLVNIFSNTQTILIGSFNCSYRGDAEDFHTSFCLSLPEVKSEFVWGLICVINK